VFNSYYLCNKGKVNVETRLFIRKDKSIVLILKIFNEIKLMDKFPKFIIETNDELGDCLIVAKCTYHKQLVSDITKTKGGGWWTLDFDNSLFTLYGDSKDLGKAKILDIAKCVQNKKVFQSSSLRRFLTDRYKFQYKNEVGEITDLENYDINI